MAIMQTAETFDLHGSQLILEEEMLLKRKIRSLLYSGIFGRHLVAKKKLFVLFLLQLLTEI